MHLPAIVKTRKRKRGRGAASGGAKSGRGMKGQRSRAGHTERRGFEGGQTPLYQRLPKGRGTKQISASQVRKPVALPVRELARFEAGAIVGLGVLRKAGLIERAQTVKLVGGGEIDKQLTVRVHAATEQARERIKAAGGKVEIIP